MKIETTTILEKTATAFRDSKVVVSYGGSSSGKTIAALYLLTLIAMTKEDREIAIVGRSVPVLKRNTIKDWKRIVMKGMYDRNKWHDTDRIYTFDSGSKMRFINGYDPDVLIGYRCDYFLIDEANYIKEGVFTHLFMRQAKGIIAFNPAKKFWANKLMQSNIASVVHSTYKDNEFCPQDAKDNLESLINLSPNFYRVYCLGEWGQTEGLVYEKYNLVDEMPQSFDFETIGIDFGWNDKMAATHIRFVGMECYVKQIFYKSKADHKELANIIKSINPNILCYCDEAAPRERVVLNMLGIEAIPFNKRGGVMSSIMALQTVKLNITKDSTDFIEEISNYSFILDRSSNEYIDKPVKGNDHLLDSWRYGAADYVMYHLPHIIQEKLC